MAIDDLRDLDKYVREIVKASQAIDSYAKGAKAAGDITTDQFNKIQKGIVQLKDDSKKHVKDTVDNFIEEFDRANSAIGKLDKSWKEFKTELSKKFQMGEVFGDLSKGLGLGAGMGAISSMIPGGGLIGLMLTGGKKGAEWGAATNRALYGIRALGEDASRYVKQVGGQVRAMDDAWGSMGAEVEATITSFSKMSIGTEQFGKASQTAHGFMQNISGTATAIDLLNGVQPGETAKLIGTTMQQSSMSIKEASDQVFNLAGNLRELHLDYGMFGQGIIQANSALRLQNQSLGDTTRLFTDLRKGLGDQGMTKTQAGAMALSGIQAGMQAIGGLNEGVQGKIAQQLAMRGVRGFAGMTDPAALITQFQFGMTGNKAGGFASDVFRELKSFAVQAAGGRPGESEHERQNRQIFALEKIGGMPPEAARAIIMTGKATEDQLDPVRATAHHIAGLDSTFKQYAARSSAWEGMVRNIQNDIADIGNSLLKLILPSIRLIFNSIERLALWAKDKFGIEDDDDATRRKLLEDESRSLQGDITDATDRLGTSIDKLGTDLQRHAVGFGASSTSRAIAEQLNQLGKGRPANKAGLDALVSQISFSSDDSMSPAQRQVYQQAVRDYARETIRSQYDPRQSDAHKHLLLSQGAAAAQKHALETQVINGRQLRFKLTVVDGGPAHEPSGKATQPHG